MSFWRARKESGGCKNIFAVTIAWEFIPLLILILTAAVIAYLKR